MKFIVLEEVDSTNSYVAAHQSELENLTMVIAESQTAGRGQRGNSWESEPGKNLTFTLLWRSNGIPPADQFVISEAVALGVVDFLRSEGLEAKVKWPNDIYVGDKKIAGILIEHSITPASVENSRIGIGLNVNQERFVSDAPNPVSMISIDGRLREISRVAAALGDALNNRLAQCENPRIRPDLHAEFVDSLWRRDGSPYQFRRKDTGGIFPGVIEAVDPKGPILIRNFEDNSIDSYYFKELEFIL